MYLVFWSVALTDFPEMSALLGSHAFVVLNSNFDVGHDNFYDDMATVYFRINKHLKFLCNFSFFHIIFHYIFPPLTTPKTSPLLYLLNVISLKYCQPSKQKKLGTTTTKNKTPEDQC